MRILLFLGSFAMLFWLYREMTLMPAAKPLQTVQKDSLSLMPDDSSATPALPATPWTYDSMAVHLLLEEMLKKCKDTIPVEFAAQLIMLMDSSMQVYPSEVFKKQSNTKLENFFKLANMDADAENELLLHIDDLEAQLFIFERIAGFWRVKDSKKYISIAISGMGNQGGYCKVQAKFKNILIYHTINYGSGASSVGEYLTDIYCYNGDSLTLGLSILNGYITGMPLPMSYVIEHKMNQLSPEKIEVLYQPMFSSIMDDATLKMPVLKALYVLNPKSKLYELKTKLNPQKSNVVIGNEIGFISSALTPAICAFKPEILNFFKKGNKVQKKLAAEIIEAVKTHNVECK